MVDIRLITILPSPPVAGIATQTQISGGGGAGTINSLPPGTTLSGFIINRDAGGNPILRTEKGDVVFESQFFLKIGSEVEIRVQNTGGNSIARILSVNGQAPELAESQSSFSQEPSVVLPSSLTGTPASTQTGQNVPAASVGLTANVEPPTLTITGTLLTPPPEEAAQAQPTPAGTQVTFKVVTLQVAAQPAAAATIAPQAAAINPALYAAYGRNTGTPAQQTAQPNNTSTAAPGAPAVVADTASVPAASGQPLTVNAVTQPVATNATPTIAANPAQLAVQTATTAAAANATSPITTTTIAAPVAVASAAPAISPANAAGIILSSIQNNIASTAPNTPLEAIANAAPAAIAQVTANVVATAPNAPVQQTAAAPAQVNTIVAAPTNNLQPETPQTAAPAAPQAAAQTTALTQAAQPQAPGAPIAAPAAPTQAAVPQAASAPALPSTQPAAPVQEAAQPAAAPVSPAASTQNSNLIASEVQNFVPPVHNAPQAGQVVEAVVIGHEASGEPLLETNVGLLRLPATTSLTTGSKLTLEITNVATPTAVIVPTQVQVAPAPLTELAQSWASLQDIFTILAGGTDALAGLDFSKYGIASLSTEATQGKDIGAAQQLPFTSGLVAFTNALRANDFKNWLGKNNVQWLQDNGHGSLVDKASAEFSALARQFANTSPGQWQTLFFPIAVDGELRQVRMFTKRERKQDNQGRSKQEDDTRFVIEMDLSQLGEMQMDGFVRRKDQDMQFDLMIRSLRALPPEVQRDIQDIYRSTAEVTGYSGSIAFQSVRAFPVSPMEEIAKQHLSNVLA